MMRDYGLMGYPHHVVRPLGRHYAMNALLVTEYCEGELLSDVIREVIQNGDHGKLYHSTHRARVLLVSVSQPNGHRRGGRLPPRLRVYGSPH